MNRTAAPSLSNVMGLPAPAHTRVTGDETFVARLRRLAAEPFLHFAVLGALVFAGHRALAVRTADVPTLEVSASKQRELLKLFEQRQHRLPTEAERAHLVKRYAEDEALFREGQRLALLQTDPMLRAQLVARVRSLLQAEVAQKTPTEDELRRYHEGHRATFAVPETVSYREYLVPTGPHANDSARRLSSLLQRGEEPTGRELPSPTEHARRSEADLSSRLGPDLTRRVWTLPIGVWRELPSSRGVHVVRVDERTAASDPPFSSIREQLLAEFRKEQTAREFQARVERLTSQWRVRVAEQP
jgi:hypothetical protein